MIKTFKTKKYSILIGIGSLKPKKNRFKLGFYIGYNYDTEGYFRIYIFLGIFWIIDITMQVRKITKN